MKLEWHSKLNTEMVPAKNFRRTSIICTIGMCSVQLISVNCIHCTNDNGFGEAREDFAAD